MQVLGVDFQETFSPVIKLKSIYLLVAIAVEISLEIHQMDITATYLNGVLEDDVYMAQPEGCLEEGSDHLVCHLKKSLYGLPQSGRVWNISIVWLIIFVFLCLKNISVWHSHNFLLPCINVEKKFLFKLSFTCFIIE